MYFGAGTKSLDRRLAFPSLDGYTQQPWEAVYWHLRKSTMFISGHFLDLLLLRCRRISSKSFRNACGLHVKINMELLHLTSKKQSEQGWLYFQVRNA